MADTRIQGETVAEQFEVLVVLTEQGEGAVTSGTFSPTLQKAIALARIPAEADGSCAVDIRGKQLAARIVKPPFVRGGKPCEGIS